MTEQRSLHRKLAEVMGIVERIPKNGTAPQILGGFKFVQVGDAADVIRKALAERHISMLPTGMDVVGQTEHQTKSGGTSTTLDLRMFWTLTDGESGETATIVSYGAGADTGDKYSGKAQTNAMKYALLMGFLLSTGDDPELGDSSDRGKRTRQRAPDRPDEPAPLAEVPTPVLLGVETHHGLAGTSTKQSTDGEMRQTPDGPSFGFALALGDNRKLSQVQVPPPLSSALDTALGGSKKIDGLEVTVTGEMWDMPWQKDGRWLWFKRLVVSRIETPEFTLPAPTEAPTAPLFDSEAELDAALDKAGAP
jgi:hypothetical protein